MQRSVSSRTLALAALGAVLIAIFIGGLVARPLVGAAFANTIGVGGPPWHAGDSWQGKTLPPELASLADVPANERFTHFRGVQLQLTDKDNHPLRVDVTPGTVTTVSSSSLTIAGNDGVNHTYALDDKTIQRGQAARQNDHVVVATLNGSTTATAVVSVDGGGFGPGGMWRH
jgi:hypothetical protein